MTAVTAVVGAETEAGTAAGTVAVAVVAMAEIAHFPVVAEGP